MLLKPAYDVDRCPRTADRGPLFGFPLLYMPAESMLTFASTDAFVAWLQHHEETNTPIVPTIHVQLPDGIWRVRMAMNPKNAAIYPSPMYARQQPFSSVKRLVAFLRTRDCMDADEVLQMIDDLPPLAPQPPDAADVPPTLPTPLTSPPTLPTPLNIPPTLPTPLNVPPPLDAAGVPLPPNVPSLALVSEVTLAKKKAATLIQVAWRAKSLRRVLDRLEEMKRRIEWRPEHDSDDEVKSIGGVEYGEDILEAYGSIMSMEEKAVQMIGQYAKSNILHSCARAFLHMTMSGPVPLLRAAVGLPTGAFAFRALNQSTYYVSQSPKLSDKHSTLLVSTFVDPEFRLHIERLLDTSHFEPFDVFSDESRTVPIGGIVLGRFHVDVSGVDYPGVCIASIAIQGEKYSGNGTVLMELARQVLFHRNSVAKHGYIFAQCLKIPFWQYRLENGNLGKSINFQLSCHIPEYNLDRRLDMKASMIFPSDWESRVLHHAMIFDSYVSEGTGKTVATYMTRLGILPWKYFSNDQIPDTCGYLASNFLVQAHTLSLFSVDTFRDTFMDNNTPEFISNINTILGIPTTSRLNETQLLELMTHEAGDTSWVTGVMPLNHFYTCFGDTVQKKDNLKFFCMVNNGTSSSLDAEVGSHWFAVAWQV